METRPVGPSLSLKARAAILADRERKARLARYNPKRGNLRLAERLTEADLISLSDGSVKTDLSSMISPEGEPIQARKLAASDQRRLVRDGYRERVGRSKTYGPEVTMRGRKTGKMGGKQAQRAKRADALREAIAEAQAKPPKGYVIPKAPKGGWYNPPQVYRGHVHSWDVLDHPNPWECVESYEVARFTPAGGEAELISRYGRLVELEPKTPSGRFDGLGYVIQASGELDETL